MRNKIKELILLGAVGLLLIGCQDNKQYETKSEKDSERVNEATTDMNSERVGEESEANLDEVEIPSTWDTIVPSLLDTTSIYYHSENLLSLKVEKCYYKKGYPHPDFFEYGMNINPQSGEPVPLSSFFTSAEELERLILDGKCEVIFGYMYEAGEEENKKILDEYFELQGLDENVGYYYVDNEKIYVIVPDTFPSPYSIIEIDKQYTLGWD